MYQLAKEYKLGTLLFTHNGREIINHRQDVDKRLEKMIVMQLHVMIK